jgi:hypothetical protein
MDVFTSVAVSQDLDFVVKLRLVLIQSDALPAALAGFGLLSPPHTCMLSSS